MNKPVLTDQQVKAGYVIKDITIKSHDQDMWFLAPTWELVNSYKLGKINEKEYKIIYTELLDERWDLLFNKDINNLKKNLILVCYCKAGEFCHRYIAAEFLQNKGWRYYGEYKQ